MEHPSVAIYSSGVPIVRWNSFNEYVNRINSIKERFMITVANRIYVSAEYSDEFEERFRNRARLVDGMPGFVSNQVLRPVNDGDPYIVFTLWESRKDFENWVDSEEFRKGHAQSGTLPKEAFTQSNKLELHEVFQDSARPELKDEPRGGPFKVH